MKFLTDEQIAIARQNGVPISIVKQRLYYMSLEKALTTPPRQNNGQGQRQNFTQRKLIERAREHMKNQPYFPYPGRMGVWV